MPYLKNSLPSQQRRCSLAGLEAEINQWPGVVSVGIFARNRADVCLLGEAGGVRTLTFAQRGPGADVGNAV